MKVIFENDQWRVFSFHFGAVLRVYGLSPQYSAVTACKEVVKRANKGDADAIWTIMTCPEDPNLLEALAGRA